MHGRKIVLLSLVLALLAGLAFYGRGPGSRHRRAEPAEVFPGLEVSSVRSIDVTAPRGSLTLSLGEDGLWRAGAEGHPADGEAVARALADVAALKRQAVASTNLDNRALYRVDEKEGLVVRLRGEGGGDIASFVLGKEGPDMFSGYLLPQGGREVLLVSSDLRRTFERPVDSWRDRRIVKAAAAQIDTVAIRTSAGAFELRRGEEGVWRIGDRAVDAEAVGEYLGRLASLRAAGFAADDEAAAAGLDEPHAVVSYSTGGGRIDLTLGALKEEQRQRYLRAGDSETLFLVSQFAADSLVKGEADFPPPPEEKGASGEE